MEALKVKWWECKRLHLKCLTPQCDVMSERDDTSMICKNCPKFVPPRRKHRYGRGWEEVSFDDPGLVYV